MKQTRLLMGMPVTIEVIDSVITEDDIDAVYQYFTYIDEKFSTYKSSSEIMKINKGLLSKEQYSADMKTVLMLCEQTKKETHGYFDILYKGRLDPSGLVKGWAIQNASELLKKKGFRNYYVDAGGDIMMSGNNKHGMKWQVGIRNPFNRKENVKILSLTNCGIATSGTAIRGQHIYNPLAKDRLLTDIVSMTVIGPSVYDADRYATAAFAMGEKGIQFIESLEGFEGYVINNKKIATYTSGFNKYIV